MEIVGVPGSCVYAQQWAGGGKGISMCEVLSVCLGSPLLSRSAGSLCRIILWRMIRVRGLLGGW